MNDQEISLRHCARVLMRRRKVMILTFLCVFLVILLYTLATFPTYKARATVQIEKGGRVTKDFFLGSDLATQDEDLMTQVEIVRSRAVAEGVVKRLNLQMMRKPVERVYHRYLKKIEELFALKMKEQDRIQGSPNLIPVNVGEISEGATYRVIFGGNRTFQAFDRNGKNIGTGMIGTTFSYKDFSFMVEGIAKEGEELEFLVLPFGNAVKYVQNVVEVSVLGKTDIMEVSAESNDPKLASALVNNTIDQYQATIISKRTKETSLALSFIDEQVKKVDQDLNQEEERLKEFKQEKGIVVLGNDIHMVLDQITEYQKQQIATETYRTQAEIVLSELNKRSSMDKDSLFSLGVGAGIKSVLIVGLGTKLSELQAQRASLMSEYTARHPNTIQLDKRIEEIKGKIRSELTMLIKTLKSKENTVRDTIRKYEERLQDLPSVEKELAEITRRVKVGQATSEFLIQRQSELAVAKASEIGNAWVIDPAITPNTFARPKARRNLLFAFTAGIFLAVSMAFLFEYLPNTVKMPEDLSMITNSPHLGTVAHFDFSKGGQKSELIVLEKSGSPAAEALRTLRTNLAFAILDKQENGLVISSAGPEEGKSFVAANLGGVLAQSQVKVLIVDSDLRTPRQHLIFNCNKSPGIANILMADEVNYNDLPVRDTSIENLKLITSGDLPPNPSELLGSERMDGFLSAIGQKYGCILFDCPPALPVSDPLVLAKKIGNAVLVARGGVTNRNGFKQAEDRFLSLNIKVIGVILNDVDIKREMGSYYRYFDYQHAKDSNKA